MLQKVGEVRRLTSANHPVGPQILGVKNPVLLKPRIGLTCPLPMMGCAETQFAKSFGTVMYCTVLYEVDLGILSYLTPHLRTILLPRPRASEPSLDTLSRSSYITGLSYALFKGIRL